jgi:hypothetical protein
MGVESEAFGEMEKKAASAIAVAIGVKDVSEGFNHLRKSTVLATAATNVYNVAVTAGNKIMKLFNITMALNPVGVLIAALTTVAGLVYAFRDSIMDTIKSALGPFKGIIDKIYGAFVSLGEALGIVDDGVMHVYLNDNCSVVSPNTYYAFDSSSATGTDVNSFLRVSDAAGDDPGVVIYIYNCEGP